MSSEPTKSKILVQRFIEKPAISKWQLALITLLAIAFYVLVGWLTSLTGWEQGPGFALLICMIANFFVYLYYDKKISNRKTWQTDIPGNHHANNEPPFKLIGRYIIQPEEVLAAATIVWLISSAIICAKIFIK